MKKLYSVSIRLRDRYGPTVWAGHEMAESPKEAKAKAEKKFLEPFVWDPSRDTATNPEIRAINDRSGKELERLKAEQLEKAKRLGYIVLANLSKAKDPSDWVPKEELL